MLQVVHTDVRHTAVCDMYLHTNAASTAYISCHGKRSYVSKWDC